MLRPYERRMRLTRLRLIAIIITIGREYPQPSLEFHGCPTDSYLPVGGPLCLEFRWTSNFLCAHISHGILLENQESA